MSEVDALGGRDAAVETGGVATGTAEATKYGTLARSTPRNTKGATMTRSVNG